jgi:hypothetical protein
MAAHAGPSKPLEARKVKRNTKKVLQPRKAKKSSEKLRIVELERAAAEFVRRGCFLFCLH